MHACIWPSYETIPHVQLEISGDVLSTADMVVQGRDGPRRLREIDDDDDMAQLMPLSLTVSCFSNIQIGFTFLVLAHLGSPGQRAVKRVFVVRCSFHESFTSRCSVKFAGNDNSNRTSYAH